MANAPYHRWTLRFHDDAVEADFTMAQARRSVLALRWVAAGLFTIFTLTSLGIYAYYPAAARGLVWSVTIPTLAISAVAGLATWLPTFEHRQQRILGLFSAVGVVAMLNVAAHYPPERVVASGFFLPAMHTFCIYTLSGLRFPIAVACGWTLLVGYLAVVHQVFGMAGPELVRHFGALTVANLVGMLAGWQMEAATRRAFLSSQEVERERARSESLLLNILPPAIAEQLKAAPGVIAEAHDEVTVLFADIVGFTTWCAQRPPHMVVELLDQVFTAFDRLSEHHGLEKIKTIGDCYMAVAGLPQHRPDHAVAALAMARDMLDEAAALSRESGEPLRLRVGLSSGPVVAGVIGRRKFIFDLWGDTVNTASRMESHGEPGRIQCSEATARLLAGVPLEAREDVQVRGKGAMRVFLVADGASPLTADAAPPALPAAAASPPSLPSAPRSTARA